MKASEIFDLPVVSGEKAYNSNNIFQANRNSLWCATFCSDEQAKVAANCINHADALADALERIRNDACDNGMHNRTSVYLATEALAAYRGVK